MLSPWVKASAKCVWMSVLATAYYARAGEGWSTCCFMAAVVSQGTDIAHAKRLWTEIKRSIDK